MTTLIMGIQEEQSGDSVACKKQIQNQKSLTQNYIVVHKSLLKPRLWWNFFYYPTTFWITSHCLSLLFFFEGQKTDRSKPANNFSIKGWLEFLCK